MAKRLITQADVVKEGELVLDALTIHAADLGDLSPFREKLEGYLEQFRELLAQQKTAAAAKQEISRQIDQVQQTCMTLVAVVRKLVLAHYGAALDNRYGLPRVVKAITTRVDVTTCEPWFSVG